MNLCVIGNSHLAAIKLGWENIAADHPDFNITMFGAPGHLLAYTEERDGIIAPTQPATQKHFWRTGRAPQIELNQYDRFLLVAVGFNPFFLFRNYYTHPFYGLNWRWQQLVSRDCFIAAAEGAIMASPGPQMIDQIRRATDKPVELMPQAFRSDAILEGSDGHSLLFRTAVEHNDTAALSALWTEYTTGADIGASIIPQPAETMTHDIFTQRKFSDKSVQLRGDLSIARSTHSKSDCAHMNALYGQTVMSKYLDALREAEPLPGASPPDKAAETRRRDEAAAKAGTL